MAITKYLSTLLEASPELRQYVESLQAENLRLVRRGMKLEAELTTVENMLEEAKRGTPQTADRPQLE